MLDLSSRGTNSCEFRIDRLPAGRCVSHNNCLHRMQSERDRVLAVPEHRHIGSDFRRPSLQSERSRAELRWDLNGNHQYAGNDFRVHSSCACRRSS